MNKRVEEVVAGIEKWAMPITPVNEVERALITNALRSAYLMGVADSIGAQARREPEVDADARRFQHLLEGPYPFCHRGTLYHAPDDVRRAIDDSIERDVP